MIYVVSGNHARIAGEAAENSPIITLTTAIWSRLVMKTPAELVIQSPW